MAGIYEADIRGLELSISYRKKVCASTKIVVAKEQNDGTTQQQWLLI